MGKTHTHTLSIFRNVRVLALFLYLRLKSGSDVLQTCCRSISSSPPSPAFSIFSLADTFSHSDTLVSITFEGRSRLVGRELVAGEGGGGGVGVGCRTLRPPNSFPA